MMTTRATISTQATMVSRVSSTTFRPRAFSSASTTLNSRMLATVVRMAPLLRSSESRGNERS